jgi:hypothetical protein
VAHSTLWYGDRVDAFRAAYAQWGRWIILVKGLTSTVSDVLPRLLPGLIATEGWLERITHHRVAPLFRGRRELPLRLFRFCVWDSFWLGLPLRRRYVEHLRGRLDRYGYEVSRGEGHRWHWTDEIDYRAMRRLVGGQTGISEACRLHQLVKPECEAHGHRATGNGVDGERHTRAVNVWP